MKISITETNNFTAVNKTVNSDFTYVNEITEEVKNYFYRPRQIMLSVDVVAKHLHPRILGTEQIKVIKMAVIKFTCFKKVITIKQPKSMFNT
jgi:hypothetical protein